MLKILNIYFSLAALEYQDFIQAEKIHFFDSEKWKARPNSTDKLNIANHLAFTRIGNEFSFDYITSSFLDSDDVSIKSTLENYGLVIVHQAPGKKWIEQLAKLVITLRQLKKKPRVIFGTELTWTSPSVRDVINDEDMKWIFCENTLLRHTPKTDRFTYFSEQFVNRNIVEFDLGIDTEYFNYGDMITEREYITFVRAPEGRVTKNNDDIDKIISKLSESPVFKEKTIKTLNPPYSTSEFKEIMKKSFAFIMTSDSETFSYCLNEAKSMGTICFYPSHMYSTKFGAKFVVDNYAKSFGRYSSHDDLILQLRSLVNNSELSLKTSWHNRKHIVDNFSIKELAEQWKHLINRNKPTSTLYIFDRSFKRLTNSELIEKCKSINADYVMPLYNNDHLCWEDNYFTSLALSSELPIIKYFISQTRGGLFRSFYDNERKMPLFGLGAPINKLPELEIREYASLITRIYRLTHIIVDTELECDLFIKELSQLENVCIDYV